VLAVLKSGSSLAVLLQAMLRQTLLLTVSRNIAPPRHQMPFRDTSLEPRQQERSKSAEQEMQGADSKKRVLAVEAETLAFKVGSPDFMHTPKLDAGVFFSMSNLRHLILELNVGSPDCTCQT
jgi:hypothetical protein